MNILWYYRHEQQVVGPVPQQAIERYLILGRLKMDDEVRTGDSPWLKIGDCPEFSSTCELLRGGGEAKLSAARRFADERSRFRRVDGQSPAENHRREERRSEEPKEIKELRSHRAVVFEPPKQKSWMGYLLIACLIGLVLLAVVFYHPVNPIKVGVSGH